MTTAPAVEQYHQLRAEHPVLARFPSAPALLTHLARASQHLDEADQIYAALVRAVQSGSRAAPTAHALLMCGLWAGLEPIYRRRRRRFLGGDHELPVTLAGTFVVLVATIDLRVVRRVAATLVRSTAREMARAARRARRGTEDSTEPMGPHVLEALPAPAMNDAVFRAELAALHSVLQPIVGADAELVLRVLVLEERPSVAAARLGLTLHTARKRIQRAARRIRKSVPKDQ